MKKAIILGTVLLTTVLTGCSADKTSSDNKVKSTDKTFIMMKNYIETEEGETHDVYVKYDGEDEQKIATKIPVQSSIGYLSGEKSVLIPDSEANLYKYSKDGEKSKIATDLGYQEYQHMTPYRVSSNNKTIAYVTEDDALYAVFENKDKVKVSSEVSRFEVSSNGEYIYYTDDDENLYSFSSNEEKEKISSDINDYRIINGGEDVLFTSNDEDFYIKNINKDDKEKIDTGEILLYQVLVEKDSISYLNEYDSENSKGELYLYNTKEGKTKIASDVSSFRKVGNDFYYINAEGNLYKKNVKDDKSEKMASDVKYMTIANNDVIYVDKDLNAYKCKANKEPEKVASNLKGEYISILNDKDLFYITKDNDVMLNDEKILSDVKEYFLSGNTIAYINNNNEVHTYDLKSKNDELVISNAKAYTQIKFENYTLYRNELEPSDIQGPWKWDDGYGGIAIYDFKGNDKMTMHYSGNSNRDIKYKVLSSSLNEMSIELIDDPVFGYMYITKIDDKTLEIEVDGYYYTFTKATAKDLENVKNEQPIEEAEGEEGAEEDASSSDALGKDIKVAIDEFIQDYEYDYVRAVNSGDFYHVSDYLVYNGKLYADHSQNIPSYFERGISETFYSADVYKIDKINDREYRVSVKEKIGIIKDGSEEIKEFDSTYVVEYNDDEFKIREML